RRRHPHARRPPGDARQGRHARDGDLHRARARLRVGREARAGGAAHQRHPAGRQLLAGADAPRERLLLEVWTDGSVTPAVAVGEASRILQDHFTLLTDFPDAMPEEEESARDEAHPRTELNDNLFRNVDELE